MPFRFVSEHADGRSLVRDRFKKLPASTKNAAVNSLVFDAQLLTAPHAVYALRAQDIAKGKSLDDSVHQRGHRYIIHSAGQPAAAAEIHRDAHGEGHHFVDVNIGRFVGATVHALKHLATLDVVRSGSYEARLLRCRALFFMAIWLKADHGNDLIYPLMGGAPAPFKPEQFYSQDDLAQNIQAILKNRRVNAKTKPASASSLLSLLNRRS